MYKRQAQQKENTRLPVLKEQLRDTEKRLANLLEAIEQGILTPVSYTHLHGIGIAVFGRKNHLAAQLVHKAALARDAELGGKGSMDTVSYTHLDVYKRQGLKGDAAAQTKALLAEKQPLEVVDEALIPALDIVGAKYENCLLYTSRCV